MSGRSRPLPVVGAAFAVIAVVGYTVFGWRFGGETNPIAVGVALVAVAIAVGSTIQRRL